MSTPNSIIAVYAKAATPPATANRVRTAKRTREAPTEHLDIRDPKLIAFRFIQA